MTDTQDRQRRTQLVEWFTRNQRDLPWRGQRSVYRTWISEIMLQQTTVATVIPFFERFLRSFPDVGALAGAREADVLAHWTGLGYYRRARHLHQAARTIMDEGGGRFPETVADWKRLPGIGDYAAGAIASQAQGVVAPAVDANARRVLTRWFCETPDQARGLKDRALRDLAATLVPEADPGQWNEAVMELGAMVCRARRPLCETCPVLDQCAAGLAGTAELIPPPPARAASVEVHLAVLVVRSGEKVLLVDPLADFPLALDDGPVPVREALGGLHSGLFRLPSTAWYPDEGGVPELLTRGGLARRWIRGIFAGTRTGGDPWQPRLVGTFQHAITRYRMKVRVWHLELAPDDPPIPPVGTAWLPDLGGLPLSSLVTKSLGLIG